MKEKSYTQLSLILDHLFIPSKTLASAIHVDASMISRWRSNKRKLNNKSEHYSNIINFILYWDERINYQNIITFLVDYYPRNSYETRSDVYKAIDMWLSEQSISPSASSDHPLIPSPASTIQINTLNTITEKKNALLYMLDVALSLSDNRNLYILMDTSADKLLNDDNFYEKWIERLKILATRDVSIHFVYSGYFFGSSIINMDNFLNLCFSQNYHAYYMTKSGGHPFMLCVLEETFAITNFIYIPEEKNPAFFTFTDRKLLYRFRQYYLNQLNNCQQFVNYSNYPYNFFDRADFSKDEDRRLCCYDPTPFLFPVPPELFEELLDFNRFDTQTKASVMKRYMSIIYRPFMTADNPYTHNLILDINEMKKVLGSADNIIMCKILTEDEILIPRSFFSKYIETILDFIRAHMDGNKPPFDVFLITDSDATLPHDSSIFTVDGLFAYTHSYSMDKYLMITNPSIATDIYKYMRQVWDELPEENHYTKNSLLLLENLLAALS